MMCLCMYVLPVTFSHITKMLLTGVIFIQTKKISVTGHSK